MDVGRGGLTFGYFWGLSRCVCRWTKDREPCVARWVKPRGERQLSKRQQVILLRDGTNEMRQTYGVRRTNVLSLGLGLLITLVFSNIV